MECCGSLSSNANQNCCLEILNEETETWSFWTPRDVVRDTIQHANTLHNCSVMLPRNCSSTRHNRPHEICLAKHTPLVGSSNSSTDLMQKIFSISHCTFRWKIVHGQNDHIFKIHMCNMDNPSNGWWQLRSWK